MRQLSVLIIDDDDAGIQRWSQKIGHVAKVEF